MHIEHNYTKIKGLDSGKITSLPNLHASFPSSPRINRMLIRESFAYDESRHDSYPKFPRSPLGTRGLQTRSHTLKKRETPAFLECHSAKACSFKRERFIAAERPKGASSNIIRI